MKKSTCLTFSAMSTKFTRNALEFGYRSFGEGYCFQFSLSRSIILLFLYNTHAARIHAFVYFLEPTHRTVHHVDPLALMLTLFKKFCSLVSSSFEAALKIAHVRPIILLIPSAVSTIGSPVYYSHCTHKSPFKVSQLL